MKSLRTILTLALLVGAPRPVAGAQAPPAQPAPASQNPSPMVETTRAHERLARRDLGGTHRSFTGPRERPVELWIPAAIANDRTIDVVIHFHGAAWLPHQAVASLDSPTVAVAVNLGAGSGSYDRAFSDPAVFDALLDSIAHAVSAVARRDVRLRRITLSGFSAGHGAIRAILRDAAHFDRVDDILLLDGMHTSYVPERRVLADSGALDEANLRTLTDFARAAMHGEKRILVTHSTIFPGTFASTTETADHLLRALGLRRTPVLQWGPRGMQQLSEARAAGFELLGFAGNTAPDHVDHLHAMPELLARLLAVPSTRCQ